MYETFEHTADLGLRVQATSLNELFAEAGSGMTSLIVEDPTSVSPNQNRSLKLTAPNLDYLYFDWLNELLYLYESEDYLCAQFQVEIHSNLEQDENSIWNLVAKMSGERVDGNKHELSHEVKAITYHQLFVKEVEGGWLAEVIVDI